MSNIYQNKYWLFGAGEDEVAKRWVACDSHKTIVYSSPRAVELEEGGNHLVPELPVPPEGCVVAVISVNDAEQCGVTLGIAHWGGDGGRIDPDGARQDDQKHHDKGKENGTFEDDWTDLADKGRVAWDAN